MANLNDALLLLKQKRFSEAKEILEDLAEKNPEDVDVLYNLGMLYSELKNPETAMRTLKKCIELQPKHSNALVALGFAYYNMSNLFDARKCFMEALTIEPDNPYALRNLGALFARKKDFGKALYYLKRAQEILPDDAQILYGLGLAYSELNDNEGADRVFKKIVALPDAPEDFKELARTELTKLAVSTVKEKGFRMDVMFYCLSALKIFSKMDISEIKNVCFKIGLKGQSGFDINDPERKYQLKSLPGSFSGLQLLSYMYTGFRQFAPEVDVGADFSNEYQMAQQLFNSEDIV
jgi:tetratricopeptide (TPR) repeat protein